MGKCFHLEEVVHYEDRGGEEKTIVLGGGIGGRLALRTGVTDRVPRDQM